MDSGGGDRAIKMKSMLAGQEERRGFLRPGAGTGKFRARDLSQPS